MQVCFDVINNNSLSLSVFADFESVCVSLYYIYYQSVLHLDVIGDLLHINDLCSNFIDC